MSRPARLYARDPADRLRPGSMAVVLASGLVFGTLLTLGVVSTICAVPFRIKTPG